MSVMAKKAALEAAAAALDEKERIQQDILQLQQRAKRLDLKVTMDALQAEQEALEEEAEEDESGSEAEDDGDCEERRMQRVQGWVDTQPPRMKPMPQQQQALYTGPAQQRVLHMSLMQPTPGENAHQLEKYVLLHIAVSTAVVACRG